MLGYPALLAVFVVYLSLGHLIPQVGKLPASSSGHSRSLAMALVLFAVVEKPLSLATVTPPKANPEARGEASSATSPIGVV